MEQLGIKQLDSVIQVGGTEYEIVAETAKKVGHKLIITKAGEEPVTFNGSDEVTIDIATTENANQIQVNMDDGSPYATITISTEEPSNGSVGDIWFKY